MEFLRDLFSLFGRILISGPFLWSAYQKLTHWNQCLGNMKGKGVLHADLILPIMVLLKIIGGLMVLVGFHAHVGAFLLAIAVVFALVQFHPFWKYQGPEREKELKIFMKEVAILGGLLMILALGAGKYSFD